MQKSVKHLSIIGKNDRWETPQDVYEKFCKKVDIHPELDVCATRETAKCKLYFGPDHHNFNRKNGLANVWDRPFFMNPPYSEKEIWLDYAINQAIAWGVPCIILVFAKTDTKWWDIFVTQNDFVNVHFHKGRIHFWENGKPSKNAAPYGNAWLVINS